MKMNASVAPMCVKRVRMLSDMEKGCHRVLDIPIGGFPGSSLSAPLQRLRSGSPGVTAKLTAYLPLWAQMWAEVCDMLRHMRLHIVLDDDLVAEIDRRAGERKRSGYIARIVRNAIDDENRWDEIEAGIGVLSDEGHEWDDDAAAWVRAQRSDVSRTG